MKKFSSFFTLIEIVVSLAILALSLTAILEMMMTSQKRLAKSYEKWERMHILTQAAEFYLLQGDDPVSITEEFFPYKNYEVDVAIEDIEGLPDEYTNMDGQVPLKCVVLSLRDARKNEVVETLRIDRLSYESEESGNLSSGN